ncbi:MAG: hypothetical protein GY810_18465 [Aureispira sp.]|nr:hypothetical protein [Aureispira sp.]
MKRVIMGIAMPLLLMSWSNKPTDTTTFPETNQQQKWVTEAVDLLAGFYSNKNAVQMGLTDIPGEISIVPIWPKLKKNGDHWLYVTCMKSEDRNTPVLQQVYRLKKLNENAIVINSYSLREPEAYSSDWTKSTPLANATPSDLIPLLDADLWMVQTDNPDLYLLKHVQPSSSISKLVEEGHAHHVDMNITPQYLGIRLSIFAEDTQLTFRHDDFLHFDRLPSSEVAKITKNVN